MNALSSRCFALPGVVLLSLSLLTSPADALDVPPAPGEPEQMPVLYVHGFNDDGVLWAIGSVETAFQPLDEQRLRYFIDGPAEAPATMLSDAGITSWAVQWWAASGDSPSAFADPETTEETGYAFLQTPAELLSGADWIGGTWTLQNRAKPSAIDVLLATDGLETHVATDLLLPALLRFALPGEGLTKAKLAAHLLIENTYNDAGATDPKAQDLLDLLRSQRRPGGRLEDWSQVNIITHSQGSLVTRAMLHKAEESSVEDSEFVANVIYNAPPFAGSFMAHIDQLIYEPADVGDALYNDPLLNRVFEEKFSEGADAAGEKLNSLGDLLELLVASSALETRFGLLEEASFLIDALKATLDSQKLDGAPLSDLAGTASGAVLGGVLTEARGMIAPFLGLPTFPSIYDLTPAGGVRHLTDYTTNPRVKQFVTLGTGGARINLFPADLQAIADDPNVLTDAAELTLQPDDTYVARDSARLLTQTDAFGPRMTLLGEFPFDHGGMIYSEAETMVPVWVETLLTAPTTLRLTGTATEVDSATRSYLVDGSTTFSFHSTPVSRTVAGEEITATAVAHQYRVVADDGSASVAGDWHEVSPGASRTFASLATEEELANQPFFLEWRSINASGAREMIRSARFVVIAEAPQVNHYYIHTPTQIEVHRNERNVRLPGTGVRNSFVQEIALQNALDLEFLQEIEANPEASWIVSQPGTKALAAVLDLRGDIDYVWDDSSFADPERLTDVNALFLTLADLDEGYHTLHFQTRIETSLGGQTEVRLGPRQRINILVDNTPPEVVFSGETNHALGFVVGPFTPLRISVHDIASNGGFGTVDVPLHPDGAVPVNTTFTLSETGLQQQMADAGIDGGFVTLTATVEDLVGNTAVYPIEVFYDIAPPEVTLAAIPGALPSGEIYRVFSNEIDLAVDVADSGGGGFDLPFAQVTSLINGTTVVTTPELTLGGVNGQSDAYGGTVLLAPGMNTVIVSVTDLGGNLGTLVLQIEFVQEVFDQEPVELLSARLTDGTFFDDEGEPAFSAPGGIVNVDTSFHGDVFVFESDGNSFVAGDTNQRRDVFSGEGGVIRRISQNGEGDQAEGGDGQSDHPAISGNGRYIVFRSTATNFVPGSFNGGQNLFLKDLHTGQMAVVSRRADGTPANVGGVVSFQNSDISYSGRYVYYASSFNDHVVGVSDTNNARDIFVVDLDPDGDGDLFDDNYVTSLVSSAAGNPSQTADGESRDPQVNAAGDQLVFLTSSSNLHAQLTTNPANTRNAVRVTFAKDGDEILPAERTVIPLNRSKAFFGNEPITLTATGAERVAISPLNHQAAFSTRTNVSNISPYPDVNSQSLGQDVYIAIGSADNPFLAWTSHSYDSSSQAAFQSSETIDAPFRALSLGLHEPITNFTAHKVAWISRHNNIEENDTNGVEDLFIRINDQGHPRADLPIVNWITSSQPSAAPVTDGGVTPDGRYAWWVTTQSYTTPYSSAGPAELYRRRLDPIYTKQLTINIVGGGQVLRDPAGETTESAGTFEYADTDEVTLTAIAETGFRFDYWEGADRSTGNVATVRTSEDRTVVAHFSATQAPVSATVEIETVQDEPSEPVAPAITGGSGETFVVSVVDPPSHGSATVVSNRLIYAPDPGFFGSDAFAFQVTNPYGQSLETPAVADVTVHQLQLPPTSTALQTTAASETLGSPILPDVSDPTPDEHFVYEIASQPENGTASVVNRGIIYTPASGFTGTDTFTYTVTDAAGNTITGVARIEVRAPVPIDRQIISGVAHDGATFRITFETESGFTYLLDYKEELTDSHWVPVKTIPGSGDFVEAVDSVAAENSRFYRIRRIVVPVE